MKIFKDIISGDELCSDTYPMILVDDVVFEVEGKRVTKTDSNDFNIGGNPSAEAAEEDESVEGPVSTTVINIVDAHALTQTTFDKKSYMAYIRGYMKSVLERVKTTKPERAEIFQKNVQPFVKKILDNIADYDFFTGPSMNPDGMVVLLFYKEDGLIPYFYLFKDGLDEEKVWKIQLHCFGFLEIATTTKWYRPLSWTVYFLCNQCCISTEQYKVI